MLRRSIRRSFRVGFSVGLLAGLGFVLFKLVQSRRSSPLSGGADWVSASRRPTSPSRPANETPLVEPDMLSVRKPTDDNGQRGAPSPLVTVAQAPPVVVEPDPAPAAASEQPEPAFEPPPSAAPEAESPASTIQPPTAPPAKAVAPVTKRAAAAKKASKAARKVVKAWVDPKGAFCPSSHPIKGKLTSGIYHLPGMIAYERTTPDRCYHDEDGAEADGLRKAKR